MLNHRIRRAFTLIELLVVISIVSLLMAILMPALGNARNKAKVIQCTSNQRQVAISIMTYAAANRDYFPSAYDFSQSFNFQGTAYSSSVGVFWQHRLALDDLLPGKNSKTTVSGLVCPLDQTPWSAPGWAGTPALANAIPSSFGINPTLGFHVWSTSVTDDYWWSPSGFNHKPQWGGSQWPRVRISDVVAASEKILLADVMAGESLSEIDPNGTWGPNGSGDENWSEWAWGRHEGLPYTWLMNGGSANVTYVDGHVKVAKQGNDWDSTVDDINTLYTGYATYQQGRRQWLPNGYK